MDLHFHKYHGTGNDFILVDGRFASQHMSTRQIARLCDRHFGIGADGLIILDEAKGYDFRMTYYNSDGNESTMCGNGGRCIVAFADFLSLIENEAHFLAIDGAHEARILARGLDSYHISLRMNDVASIVKWNEDIVTNTGSPHLVRFVDSLEIEDIKAMARPLRYHVDFAPVGINVNFVMELPDGIRMRTYERGVEDETLSCGTGATASALAYAFKKKITSGIIPVQSPGGDLQVKFKALPGGGYTDIWLEGPAVRVFEGKVEL